MNKRGAILSYATRQTRYELKRDPPETPESTPEPEFDANLAARAIEWHPTGNDSDENEREGNAGPSTSDWHPSGSVADEEDVEEENDSVDIDWF